MMPAWLGRSRDLAVKVVSVRPTNPGRGLPRIVGVVVLFDGKTGLPIALLDGATLTALRTAAVTALATRLLSRKDVRSLAILGAGALAADQLAAVLAVREIHDVRVFAPTRAHAEAVVRTVPNWVRGRVATSAADAVRGADLVVTVTSSSSPVFEDRDLARGAHVAAVGAWRPDMQEIPGATMARATVVADDRAAAWAESGDLIVARNEGWIGDDHVRAELGDLVSGRHPGRTSDAEITLFESVGLAIEDAALGGVALAAAEARGLGTLVTL